MNLLKCLTFALLIVISACSRTPLQPALPAKDTDLTTIQHWQLRGKIGLRGTDFAESAYINWQQCIDNFTAQLNGPLGTGSVRLTGNSDRTTITTADESFSTNSPQQWLFDHFGWQLPVMHLPYWLKGIPAPGLPHQPIEQGFEQLGWHILQLRHLSIERHLMPAKLIIQNPELKITLIIKDWQLSPNCQATPS